MASLQREEIPITNEGMGQPLSATNQVLTAGAAVTQVRDPMFTPSLHNGLMSLGLSASQEYLCSSQRISCIRG